MQFDKGYASPHFVTNKAEMKVELDDPYILIYDKKLTSLKDLMPGS
jgi:chaperonin GroEL